MGSLSQLGAKPCLVIGRAGMDLYADPPGTAIEEATRFTTALGGSSANIAVALTRAGGKAALLTCVSDDAVGRFCLAQLDHYGIDRASKNDDYAIGLSYPVLGFTGTVSYSDIENGDSITAVTLKKTF